MAVINGTSNADTLSGTAEQDTIDGRGGNDRIFGMNGADILIGGTGNDEIFGGFANELILGGSGNDKLHGFFGRDTLVGGGGNDTYFLNGDLNAPSASVRVIEEFNGGIDTIVVAPQSDFTLFPNVEILKLVTGNSPDSFAIKASGNELNNIIIGNSLNNTLSGLGGNDTLRGGTGDETFLGGPGNDVLTGGAGSDTFIFNTSREFVAAEFGVDTITDFTPASSDPIAFDQFVLSKTSFTALTSDSGTGFSVASEYAQVNNSKAAATSDAFIVYDTVSGNVFYNQNGADLGFGTGALFANVRFDPNNVQGQDFTLQS